MNRARRDIRAIRARISPLPPPSVADPGIHGGDPFAILVATVISLRTKDAVTAVAGRRLLGLAPDAGRLASLPVETIEQAIYPCGFFRNKAAQLKEIARILTAEYAGAVPGEREALLSLPGVGPKTANLVLGLGFGIPAICVDIHVHRVANRLGWIRTRTPEASEKALEAVLPESEWIGINHLLVIFGQRICRPISPLCSQCPLGKDCPKEGVDRSR